MYLQVYSIELCVSSWLPICIAWAAYPVSMLFAYVEVPAGLSATCFLKRCSLEHSLFVVWAAITPDRDMPGDHTRHWSIKFRHDKFTHVGCIKDSWNIHKGNLMHPSIDAWAKGAYVLAYAGWSYTTPSQWQMHAGSEDSYFSATEWWCRLSPRSMFWHVSFFFFFALVMIDGTMVLLQWHCKLRVYDRGLGIRPSVLRTSLKKTAECQNFAAEVR